VETGTVLDKPASTPPGQRKFAHPDITAKGETRASVRFTGLKTLWLNTGTLCNIECANCYIESSPRNDRLAYLTRADAAQALDEAQIVAGAPFTVGFTGGEPFMNPDLPSMLEDTLSRGLETLVLTNAMKPMMRPRVQAALRNLQQRFGNRLTLRVSLDHWREDLHDEERGPGAFRETLDGLKWLVASGITITIAGRLRWGDADADMRAGFASLFAQEGLTLDTSDPATLVLFPEMDERAEVPEITVDCWRILNKSPDDMMCASSRMVVRRKGAPGLSVVACTLLPYEPQFDLGDSLKSALDPVRLNHPHCAKFCVLGGGSCKA
jgi:uncharacterized Fe-S cluster-containing radical SAM superfamily protein